MVGDLSRVVALIRSGTVLARGRPRTPAQAPSPPRPRGPTPPLPPPAGPPSRPGPGAPGFTRAAGRRPVFPVPPAGVFAVAPKTTYPLVTARNEDHYLVAPEGGRN